MSELPLLSFITFLPLLGAVALFLGVRGQGDDPRGAALSRGIALGVSLLTFVLSLLLLAGFDPAAPGFQFVERYDWIPSFNIVHLKGIDGISIWFVLLATLLTPICVLSGFVIGQRVKAFMIALLALETMMVGMFTALDIVLFYVFFEGVLIPMFLIVGVWGGKGRIYAAYKFFLYTFLGSLLMLVAVFAMTLQAGTTDMTVLMKTPFPRDMALALWLAFFASFAVKTPMWPFHTWLPYAHVEAPTAGSVILAGVLLKMGGYGFIRLGLQILPDASQVFAPLVMILSVVAVIYASLVALAQTDMKKLIAYSSVAHMGAVTLGIFSMTTQGLEGAMLVMLSHGVVSAALFLAVGVLYDRLHTRDIARYGGVAKVMPVYACFYMLFMLASVGLPGTSGFVGEFLALQGAWLAGKGYAILAATGVVLGAAYMLWLTRRVFFGPADKAEVQALPDLNAREVCMFLPLLALVVWMGVHPSTFRSVFAPAAQHVLESLKAPRDGGTP